jgi:hypothetical protein
MRRSSRVTQWVAVTLLVVAAVAYYEDVAERERDWVRVTRDANHDIAIDRATVTPIEVAWHGHWLGALEVSFRTDHALPRPHKGKTFTREIVRAVVQCDSLFFKVLSVDMSVGDGRLVARQRTTDDDLWHQQWRRVERGTTEETAALAACHFGYQAGTRIADVRRK